MWPTWCSYAASVAMAHDICSVSAVQPTLTGHRQKQNRDRRSTKAFHLSVVLCAKNGGTNIYFQRRPGTASSILI
jgi:hypothetical protein